MDNKASGKVALLSAVLIALFAAMHTTASTAMLADFFEVMTWH